MSERIDLTDGALRKQIHEHEKQYYEASEDMLETILHCVKGIGLIAELKRCYEELDRMREEAKSMLEYLESEDGWKIKYNEILDFTKTIIEASE
jgi:hypothetical protein